MDKDHFRQSFLQWGVGISTVGTCSLVALIISMQSNFAVLNESLKHTQNSMVIVQQDVRGLKESKTTQEINQNELLRYKEESQKRFKNFSRYIHDLREEIESLKEGEE